MGGGLFGQGAQVLAWFSRSVASGEAEGDVGPSWASGQVRGDVLLRLLVSLGDVRASALDGIEAVRQDDYVRVVDPLGWYRVSCVEV